MLFARTVIYIYIHMLEKGRKRKKFSRSLRIKIWQISLYIYDESNGVYGGGA
jgi:hypothetical protein